MFDLSDLQSWFSTARSEYESSNHSVYSGFVVPPDIDSNDISQIQHSIALVGGRGTGKTVFLKYFSHWTRFDARRVDVDESDLRSIVLYWKPDTAFCRALKFEWLGEESAKNAFLTLASLEIVKEFVDSIRNISHHFPEIGKTIFSDKTFWAAISRILGEVVEDNDSFDLKIEMSIYSVQTEPDNILHKANPKAALDLLIQRVLKVAFDWFSNTSFKVFVDEFENLSEYQQKIINDYRKHSTAQSSWNVAYKKYAKISSATTGVENLNDKEDYHTLDIFNDFSDDVYRFFMAEIVLNNMVRKGLGLTKIPIFKPEFLSDRKNLALRARLEYKQEVLREINRLFPNPSIMALCKHACDNGAVKKKLQKAFLDVGFSEEFFNTVISNFPNVAIAHFVIFYQKGFQKNLISEKEKLRCFIESHGVEPKAVGEKVATYVYSALLQLNLDNSYINVPVYAGFDRFCFLSSRSVRSMISLVFYTIRVGRNASEHSFQSIEDIPVFSIEQMHSGALSASEQSVGEIVNYTPHGVTLSRFTNRLGQIFRLLLSVKGLSEPEISHFDIVNDFGGFSEETKDLIQTAKAWRILIESNVTKERNEIAGAAYEYRLNPFYAPFFGISYRKIRKISFTNFEFYSLYAADSMQYILLRSRYEKQIPSQEEQPKLDL